MNSNVSFARNVGAAAVGFALLTLSALARADDQADRIKALERQLETSLQLIEKLAARVADLERSAKPVAAKPEPAAAPARADQATEIARLKEAVEQISAGLGKRDQDTGLPVHGFADVGAAWSAGADPAKRRGFGVGTLDLYLTPQFGDRVKSLAEIAFETDEGGSGTVDVERLQLGYAFNDALTVWLGRFHTPFGLWNTSFHHGANLQTSIFRPRFVEFEDRGGIIPAHTVGLWATGKTRLGGGKITYDAYLGNGPSIRQRQLDPNTLTDDDSNKMLGFNLGFQPVGALGGLTLGIHGFGSTVNAFAASGTLLNRTRLRAAGAYFGYDADDWEAIGEYYHFGNVDSGTDARRSSNAWYVHVGRAFGALTPYVRFERTSLDPNDNYFRSLQAGRSYKRSVIGARYVLDSRSSIKFELSSTDEAAMMQLDESGVLVPFLGGSYRRTALQYSIAF